MPKPTRENNHIIKAAKEYVRKQIATMKAHGSAPKLSADAVKSIINQVAAAAK